MCCCVHMSLCALSIDDEIYANFRARFPAASFPLSPLSDAVLKSASAKVAWRSFCNDYEKNPSIRDFNMGTLLRLDAALGYDPDNTTVVPRIQFFALEIARNREGHNDAIRKPNQPARDAAQASSGSS